MKRYIIAILCLLGSVALNLGLPIFADDALSNREETGFSQPSVKVLCFGNSFTEDSMGYAPYMLTAAFPNIEFTIGIAFIGGASLQQQYANFLDVDFEDLFGEVYVPKTYTYYKSRNGSPWYATKVDEVKKLLDDESWDLISFQQNGVQAYKDWNEYIGPYVVPLMDSINSQTTAHPVYILTQSAYAGSLQQFNEIWQSTALNAQITEQYTGCEVFPYGTAVQNLRNTTVGKLGDGSANCLTIDNGHLQEGIGCYTAALTNAMKIADIMGYDWMLLQDDNTEITESWLAQMKIPGLNLGTGVLGMTEVNRLLAKEAAKAAILSPYSLTEIPEVSTDISDNRVSSSSKIYNLHGERIDLSISQLSSGVYLIVDNSGEVKKIAIK